MQRSDIEEKIFKCYECAGGLSYMENILYSNRCIFCSPRRLNIPVIEFLRLAHLDWKVYQQMLRISKHPDGKLLLLGALGVIGKTDLSMFHSIGEKKLLLKELKKV